MCKLTIMIECERKRIKELNKKFNVLVTELQREKRRLKSRS